MAFLRRNHLAIAGLLCVVAILLYAVGYHFEARAVLFLAVCAEVAAWIALFSDRSEGTFPPGSTGSGANGNNAS